MLYRYSAERIKGSGNVWEISFEEEHSDIFSCKEYVDGIFNNARSTNNNPRTWIEVKEVTPLDFTVIDTGEIKKEFNKELFSTHIIELYSPVKNEKVNYVIFVEKYLNPNKEELIRMANNEEFVYVVSTTETQYGEHLSNDVVKNEEDVALLLKKFFTETVLPESQSHHMCKKDVRETIKMLSNCKTVDEAKAACDLCDLYHFDIEKVLVQSKDDLETDPLEYDEVDNDNSHGIV